MKRSWGTIKTMPGYEVKDPIYNNIMESCMVLDNNRKVHDDVSFEMNINCKEKLEKIIKDQRTDEWRQSKLPKVKVQPS